MSLIFFTVGKNYSDLVFSAQFNLPNLNDFFNIFFE